MNTVTELLFTLLCATLGCGGIAVAALPGAGNRLSKLADKMRELVDRGMMKESLAKPLLTCQTCIASTWGSLFYWTSLLCLRGTDISWSHLGLWPIVVCGTCFILHCAWTIVHTFGQIGEHHNHHNLNHRKHADAGGNTVQHQGPDGGPDGERRHAL